MRRVSSDWRSGTRMAISRGAWEGRRVAALGATGHAGQLAGSRSAQTYRLSVRATIGVVQRAPARPPPPLPPPPPPPLCRLLLQHHCLVAASLCAGGADALMKASQQPWLAALALVCVLASATRAQPLLEGAPGPLLDRIDAVGTVAGAPGPVAAEQPGAAAVDSLPAEIPYFPGRATVTVCWRPMPPSACLRSCPPPPPLLLADHAAAMPTVLSSNAHAPQWSASA